MDGIRRYMLPRDLFILCRKPPSFLQHLPVDRCDRDDVLEALQFADDESPVGPRTRIRNVQVISALFRWKLCARFLRDEVAEGRLTPFELAILSRIIGDGGVVT